MSVNERIAKWAGWKQPENPDWRPEGLIMHCSSDEEPWYDTKLQRDLGRGDRIPADEVNRAIYWTSPSGKASSDLPSFDTDITLWHGEDGLLKKILDMGLRARFEDAIEDQAGQRGTWYGMSRTPAQLATALDEVIS